MPNIGRMAFARQNRAKPYSHEMHASMNRIYRLVWNAALSTWVAVAESARGPQPKQLVAEQHALRLPGRRWCWRYLGADIDASATSSWNGGLGFDPLKPFSGSFDGLKHVVKNINIIRPTEVQIALFAYVAGGKIQNIGLEDGYQSLRSGHQRGRDRKNHRANDADRHLCRLEHGSRRQHRHRLADQ